MKYPNITFGRVEAVWNKLGGETGVERFLRGELVVREPKEIVLRFREEVLIPPLLERFVPNEFFKTQSRPYLHSCMGRMLKSAQTVEPTQGAAKFHSFSLTKDAYDLEIKLDLPGRHEVELWQIAELIKAQRNGEDGPLLTDGYANAFYVSRGSVRLYWLPERRKWRIDDWKLGEGRWLEGARVFSRN